MNHIVFDMNISKDIVKILRTLGEHRVKHLTEKYPHATDDLVFLPELAQQKALLVTCDISMVRTPTQRLMLLKANNTAIFLPDTFSQAKPWEQVHWLLVHWKRIIPQVEPGICYSVSTRGKVKPIDLRRYRRALVVAGAVQVIGGDELAVCELHGTWVASARGVIRHQAKGTALGVAVILADARIDAADAGAAVAVTQQNTPVMQAHEVRRVLPR